MLKASGTSKLIVFTRYPRPGSTKTRLIPALGPVGAAELHRILAEKTISKATQFAKKAGVALEVCFEGGDKGRMRAWLGTHIKYSPQVKGNLGQKIYKAFEKAFQQGFRRVLLIGTDIPSLDEHHLSQGFEMPAGHDVVIGPSKDGGYWAVGMKALRDIFSGVSWGSDRVLGETIERIKKAGLKFQLLETLPDVDSPSDLYLLGNSHGFDRPYISVIIPALNETQAISKSIEASQSQDAEIVVVDGGSTDGTAQIARDLGASVLMGEKGRAIQQNLGAKHSKGRVLIFVHADTMLPPGYEREVFNLLLARNTAAGAFRFRLDVRTLLLRLVEFNTHVRCLLFNMPYGDQALFMPRKIFEQVGGFPAVSLAEDFFMVRKLKKLGKVRISKLPVITSSRRWLKLGVLKTTLINQVIVGGLLLGLSPEKLAPLYKIQWQ